jgi:L-fuconolactonase
MRIDSHQHFWRYEGARFPWITPDKSLLSRDFLPQHFYPEMSAVGIDSSVAVQAEQSEHDTGFLLGLAASDSRISGVVGWVDLRDPQVSARLEYFSQFEKLRGFRHIAETEPDDAFLIRDDFLRGVSHLAGFQFTYDVLVFPKQLPAALELVTRFPDQPFVIDHIAKPLVRTGEFDHWSTYMRRIAERPNTFCKVSGLVTEADWQNWKPSQFTRYLDLVFEVFGTSRLMFGSDWPVCLLAASYSQVYQLVADYCASDRDKVFGETAAQFYGLTSQG